MFVKVEVCAVPQVTSTVAYKSIDLNCILPSNCAETNAVHLIQKRYLNARVIVTQIFSRKNVFIPLRLGWNRLEKIIFRRKTRFEKLSVSRRP